ncbi:hypothetical protein [Halorhabdus salina]|uniref:hypothetical protein n=1 Tax=Halorhabdus salina TaxID=2750670 RepID=UPI0015EE9E5F|nr:hypothetical protein [Halorhabdus salina]
MVQAASAYVLMDDERQSVLLDRERETDQPVPAPYHRVGESTHTSTGPIAAAGGSSQRRHQRLLGQRSDI